MTSVWFVGQGDQKIISTAQWLASLGVQNLPNTYWNAANGWSVNQASLTTAQINALTADTDFLTGQPDGPRTSPAPPIGAGQAKDAQAAQAYYLAALGAAQANIVAIAQNASAKLAVVGDQCISYGLMQNAQSAVGTSSYRFVIGQKCTDIVALFTHWYINLGGNKSDTDPATPITFSAGIKLVSIANAAGSVNLNTLGYVQPFSFNGGKRTVTIDGGGKIQTDPLGMNLYPGDVVDIETYISAGTAYPPRYQYGIYAGANGGFTANSDLTAAASAAPAPANGAYFGPSMLLGYVENPNQAKSLGIFGDSIDSATGDYGAIYSIPAGGSGYGCRALQGKAGLLLFGVGGDAVSTFENFFFSMRRMQFAAHITSALLGYGANDILTFNITQLQLETYLLDLAMRIRRHGVKKVFLRTLVPRTTSTDGWATTANQTPMSSEPIRLAHNAWVRAGCPIDPNTKLPVAIGTSGAMLAGTLGHPITDYFEFADVVESARNSGLWKPCKSITTVNTTASSFALAASSGTFNPATQENGGNLGDQISIAGAGSSGTYLIGTLYSIPASQSIAANMVSIAGTAPAATLNNAQMNVGLMTPDGTHPSSRSHFLLAQAIDLSKL